MTIRDLRLHWPAAEKALESEAEIVITRDGKPVARLMKFHEVARSRPRFDPNVHLAKMRKVLKGKVLKTVDGALKESRRVGDDLHRHELPDKTRPNRAGQGAKVRRGGIASAARRPRAIDPCEKPPPGDERTSGRPLARPNV